MSRTLDPFVFCFVFCCVLCDTLCVVCYMSHAFISWICEVKFCQMWMWAFIAYGIRTAYSTWHVEGHGALTSDRPAQARTTQQIQLTQQKKQYQYVRATQNSSTRNRLHIRPDPQIAINHISSNATLS
jgi:hypothetical protein